MPNSGSPTTPQAADPSLAEFPDLDLMALLPPELRQPAPQPGQPRHAAATSPAPPVPLGDPTAAWATEATSFAFTLRDSGPADLPPAAAHQLEAATASLSSLSDFLSDGLRHLESPATMAEDPRALPPNASPPAPDLAPSGPAATGFAAFLADGMRQLGAPSPRESSPPLAAEPPPPPSAPQPAPTPPAPRPAARPSPPIDWALPASASLAGAREIAGLVAACLVDGEEGLLLAAEGRGLDLEAAAAHGTEVVRAERRAIELLGLRDDIEDILVTTGRRLFVIRPLRALPTTFLYLILDRKAANLGMARIQLDRIESGLGP